MVSARFCDGREWRKMVVARRGDVCAVMVRRDAEVGGDGTVARVAAAAAMVMEREEKIRVRVLGDEDDDVAESDWLIW